MDKNNIVKIINTSLVVVCFLIVALLASQKFDANLRFKVVDACMKVSRVEKNIPQEDAHVYYPVDDQFKKCLKANNL